MPTYRPSEELIAMTRNVEFKKLGRKTTIVVGSSGCVDPADFKYVLEDAYRSAERYLGMLKQQRFWEEGVSKND